MKKIRTNYNIILTGTIDVSKSYGGMNTLPLVDETERLNQYESAIERYICQSAFNKIVFVETSEYQAFDYKKFEKLADEHGKQFEYITFCGNFELIRERGKSSGDAEAINYALTHSELLKNEETIYKVTGRIFLTNSFTITKTKDKVRNEFFSYKKFKWHRCVTYFFKFNKEDYLKYFFDVPELCDERIEMDMEKVFYQKIVESKIQCKPFRKYPRINGIIGSQGIKYDKTPFQYFLGDIMIRLGFFTVN